jgi:hypothetical protein
VYLLSIALLFAFNSYAGVVEFSEYQKELIEEALATFDLKKEEHPEGKKIDRVIIASYDVILKQDLWPSFGNLFHIVTKKDVIQRELLFKESDVWTQTIIDESARNLRVIPFSTSPMLAIALIVPAKGKTENTLTALVVTKDLWSLRTNFAFSFVGSTLELFEVEFAEFNLAGRMKKAGVNARYDLATNSLGVVFEDARMWGTRIANKERANLIWNRGTGQVEGGNASFAVGHPLYSLATEWGWEVSASYNRDVYRLFSNASLFNYQATTGQSIPFVFNRRSVTALGQFLHSRGTEYKHNFALGVQAYTRKYEVPTPSASISQATLDEFTNAQVPFSEDASMLFFSFRDFKAEFMQLIGVESYAVTEDYQLGHDVSLIVNFADPAFGFNSSFTELYLSAGYSWDLKDDTYPWALIPEFGFSPTLFMVQTGSNKV